MSKPTVFYIMLKVKKHNKSTWLRRKVEHDPKNIH